MATDAGKIQELKESARQLRVASLKMTTLAKSGHPGGSLSEADILAALFFHRLRLNPKDPKDPARDRFVLSKAHACPALYAALAERGFFPKPELDRFRTLGSILQGHPDRNKTPGIEVSGGSLGQGYSMAAGMALAGKMDGKKHKVFVILGDGECQEGIVWETCLFAGKFSLDNLIVLVDKNGLQNDGFVKEIMPVDPLAEKFKAFGFETQEIDGHDMLQIVGALDKADQAKKPACIVCHTVKGKGVSFMENDPQWHGKALDEEQLKKALLELAGEGEKA